MTELAAIIATIILAALTIFQIALISGKPLGKFAWGGQNVVLPTTLRVASGFSIVLYLLFSMLILNQANVIHLVDRSGWVHGVFIAVTVYFFIGIIMNAISRSKHERNVMTPVAATLALLFLYVAVNVT